MANGTPQHSKPALGTGEKPYEVREIALSLIDADPKWNIRGEITEEDILDTAMEIHEDGLETPITVRPLKSGGGGGGRFHCVSGHRRFSAYQLLHEMERQEAGAGGVGSGAGGGGVGGAVGAAWKYAKIPAFVRDLDELQAKLANTRENTAHRALTQHQIGARCVEFVREYGMSPEEIAKKIDLRPEHVKNLLLLETSAAPKIHEIFVRISSRGPDVKKPRDGEPSIKELTDIVRKSQRSHEDQLHELDVLLRTKERMRRGIELDEEGRLKRGRKSDKNEVAGNVITGRCPGKKRIAEVIQTLPRAIKMRGIKGELTDDEKRCVRMALRWVLGWEPTCPVVFQKERK